AEYRQMLARVPSEIATGDPAIDALLGATEPAMCDLLCDLSVPHWFDISIVSVLNTSASDPEQLLERITGFAFVRIHPRGYAYHDDVRLALRTAVLEHRGDRYRQVARRAF